MKIVTIFRADFFDDVLKAISVDEPNKFLARLVVESSILVIGLVLPLLLVLHRQLGELRSDVF